MWRTLLLFILVLLVARALMRLFRGVMEGASSNPAAGRRGRSAPQAVKMVADPVCGTYVIPGKALQLARGRETHYFCSEKCRDQWLGAHAH